jgi:hypothetical protein
LGATFLIEIAGILSKFLMMISKSSNIIKNL